MTGRSAWCSSSSSSSPARTTSASSSTRPATWKRPLARLLEPRLLAFEGRWQEVQRTGGSDEAWVEVRARSVQCSMEQHPIEVIEVQVRGALRAGDPSGARRALEEALVVARRIPNVKEARLLRVSSALGTVR